MIFAAYADNWPGLAWPGLAADQARIFSNCLELICTFWYQIWVWYTTCVNVCECIAARPTHTHSHTHTHTWELKLSTSHIKGLPYVKAPIVSPCRWTHWPKGLFAWLAKTHMLREWCIYMEILCGCLLGECRVIRGAHTRFSPRPLLLLVC